MRRVSIVFDFNRQDPSMIKSDFVLKELYE